MVSDSDPYNSSNIKCLRLVGMFDFAGGFRLNFCLDVTKSRTAFVVLPVSNLSFTIVFLTDKFVKRLFDKKFTKSYILVHRYP